MSSISRSLASQTGAIYTVPTLAALKALTSRPEAVIVETGQAKGLWQWELGSSTTADDCLVVQCTSGTAGRYFRIVDNMQNLLWSGALNDESATITAQLQNMWTAANGTTVFVPRGNYRMDTGAARSSPVSMVGVGMGAAAYATTNTETSQFVLYSSTAYAATITNIHGSTFADMKFNVDPASRPMTAGGGLKITASSTNTAANTKVERCAFVALWNCIEIVKPVYPVIAECYFEYWINNAINFTTQSSVEGSGGTVRNNYFAGNFDADNTAGAALYSEVGYITVQSNVFIGAAYGVRFKPTNFPAGSLQVFDNHIEEQEIAGVYCEKGDDIAAMLQICRNEFSTVDHGDNEFLAHIYLKSDAGGAWLTGVQINENVVRSKTTSSTWFIDAETGTNMAICNNQFEGLALNAGNGIRVGSQADDVLVSQNKFTGTMGTKYSLTAECTLVDTVNALTFAEVNAITCKDGSFVWCGDALAGANPAAGSGSGAFLVRVGGAWVTIPTLQAANTWTGAQRISVGDSVAALLINGASKGIRFLTGAGGMTMLFTDQTGVGSHEAGFISGASLTLQIAAADKVKLDANAFLSVQSGSFGRSAPVTKNGDFTVAATENWLINNKAGSTCTVTLPSAATFPGREIMIQNYQAQTVVSASSNVVPLGGGAASTAILSGTAGRWCVLVSDATNWVIMSGVI